MLSTNILTLYKCSSSQILMDLFSIFNVIQVSSALLSPSQIDVEPDEKKSDNISTDLDCINL